MLDTISGSGSILKTSDCDSRPHLGSRLGAYLEAGIPRYKARSVGGCLSAPSGFSSSLSRGLGSANRPTLYSVEPGTQSDKSFEKKSGGQSCRQHVLRMCTRRELLELGRGANDLARSPDHVHGMTACSVQPALYSLLCTAWSTA